MQKVGMSSRRGGNVRRRLFDVDSAASEECEQLNNINGDENNEQFLDRKQEEWNFDFRSGRPLPGRYAWQPVATRRGRGFAPVTGRSAGNNEPLRSGVHTRSSRQLAPRRAADTHRNSPYNLRSRSRGTRASERGFLPIAGYRDRDRSSSRSSNTSNERLEGDVRT